MLAIIEFLKRFAPMLRSGKMSYADALTRFKAQYGRPADGLELSSIRKEVEKAPSNVFDLTGKQIDTSRPIIGGKNVANDVDGIINNLKSMEPMDAMKEANLIVGRKGQYKNLSIDESQKILKDTNDHIFSRDIQYDEFGDPIKPDPADFASGGIAGQLHLNEGGRVPMIYGGSTGLKSMIKNMIEGINKGRKDKIKTLFPKYSVEEKELLKLGEKYLPRDAATLSAREIEGKAEGIQVLIDRLKNDKKIIEQMAKNKAMNDPGLNFMMEKMENMYPPNLKKYTDIDKDILQLETIKKNLIMKDRKLNAEGGRASLSNGGLANILGV